MPANNHKSNADNSPVICVTGSAKRIGACIIEYMHSLGYRVIIHCHRSMVEANALADKLNHIRNNSAKIVTADLSDTQKLPKLADNILQCFGKLNILVHNASRFYPSSTELNLNELNNHWEELFASNTKAPFFLTHLLKDELKKQQGTVISILDIHANDRPFQGYSIYNMAKASHRMMVKTLAIEYAPVIRVNGVAPGANIWPENHSDQAIDIAAQQRISHAIPLERIGTPIDIAKAVDYLINATYVTGEVINIDGGRSLTLAGY